MTFSDRLVHRFNYLVPITEENYERQYKNALLMMRSLKTVIVLLFLYITWISIETALGNSSGLSAWFLPVFLIVVGGTISFFIFRSFKLK
jgi:hypothetical protein